MKTLTEIIDEISVFKVSQLCGVSERAIYKWRKANVLPRTDYTGETHYAEALSKELNGKLSVEKILEISRPQK